MIQQVDIENFRSIKKQSIPLKKINVLYGPNGSGKSSAMYAPYVFRNFCRNPNQRLDSLFNLGFINLGGIENVKGGQNLPMEISIRTNLKSKLDHHIFGVRSDDYVYVYSIVLDEKFGALITFEYDNAQLKDAMVVDLPYSLTEKSEISYSGSRLIWNGLTFEKLSKDTQAGRLQSAFNSVFEELNSIELISVKRGFFSPLFSTEQLTEESQFALNIRNQDRDFESKIDYYFKKIFDKTFRFVAIPGSTSFYLRTQNKKGQTTDLVNEGFGVNQTIYMLINLLKRSTSLAFIEEPEIHLHPTAQNALMDVFVEIIKNEGKQIFISTHSENIVTSLLTKISKGELDINDVQFYLATKENDETKIIPQTVNDKGQIEGGLLSFMQTELENLRSILGLNG